MALKIGRLPWWPRTTTKVLVGGEAVRGVQSQRKRCDSTTGGGERGRQDVAELPSLRMEEGGLQELGRAGRRSAPRGPRRYTALPSHLSLPIRTIR